MLKIQRKMVKYFFLIFLDVNLSELEIRYEIVSQIIILRRSELGEAFCRDQLHISKSITDCLSNELFLFLWVILNHIIMLFLNIEIEDLVFIFLWILQIYIYVLNFANGYSFNVDVLFIYGIFKIINKLRKSLIEDVKAAISEKDIWLFLKVFVPALLLSQVTMFYFACLFCGFL